MSDHRRLSGDPIVGLAVMRAAVERVFEQYTQFESRVLAVRGQRLHLLWSSWSGDDGNESKTFYVTETDDNGLVCYEGRFDEDDFEGAYRELERRYYAGEGAAFAEGGTGTSEAIAAVNRGDFDQLFGELSTGDMRIENRSSSAFPDRSASDLRMSFGELNAMVATTRTWISATCWVSPTWCVTRLDREAIGGEGEKYAWVRILVLNMSAGRIASMCDFELADEDAAFAYADEQVQATTSRLAVRNRASDTALAIGIAIEAHDVDAVARLFAEEFVREDRRRLHGNPILDIRTTFERILEQYTHVDGRTLAVRGERLHLSRGRWWNDAGYETTHLYLHEIDGNGRIASEVQFDEDDFESAYRELERRYYTGEGAAFAEAGALSTEFTIAANRGDYDRVFGEISSPDLRVENRSRSPFPDRSAAEFRAGLEDLGGMSSSVRVWASATVWQSTTCSVARVERAATGGDGERYEWTRILVVGHLDGRIGSICQFELDDEEAAFAYAEEQIRAGDGRLNLNNRASRAADAVGRALQNRDADGAAMPYSDSVVYDDRRRLHGSPPGELRYATARILEQYSHFEWHVVAVRGERLQLTWTRWSNDSGFETTYLIVFELDDDGLITYHGRFEEDDFEEAYRELERRYYAGEGASAAEAGLVSTDYLMAYNQGDLDRVFDELSEPGFQLENRSRSVFDDRSAAEFRSSIEDLSKMVASSRSWLSVICNLSPTVYVARFERESVGQDGELYRWTYADVHEFRDGRLASACRFELADEESAFAYAEERIRAGDGKLKVSNGASRAGDARGAAMNAADVDRAVACCSEDFVQDDRRRLSGDPIRGAAELRSACEQALAQYSRFEVQTLAVRGERLHLFRGRWSNNAGYESTHLGINEVDGDGLISYQARFDDDDFEAAYRELERRYYAGEGAAYAEAGATATEFETAVGRGDFDRLFGELVTPDFSVENRSRSVLADRSAPDFRAGVEQLMAMVESVRMWTSAMHWVSPTCGVARIEREAIGSDGEKYAWSDIDVVEIRDGRVASACMFEPDDEEAAFAYAQERVRAASDDSTE